MLDKMENPSQAKPVESKNSAEQLESEAQQQPQQSSMPGENADGRKLEEKPEVSESEKVEDAQEVAGSGNSEDKTVVVKKLDKSEETNSEKTENKPEETMESTVVGEQIAEPASKPGSEETPSEIPKTEVHQFDFTEITKSIEQLNTALGDLELSVSKLDTPLQMSFQKVRVALKKYCEEMKASESVSKSSLVHVDILVKSESESEEQHENITGGTVLENVPKRDESKMDIHETESEDDKSEKTLPKIEIPEIKREPALEETQESNIKTKLDTSMPEDAEKIIVDNISSVDENALKS